MFKGILGGTAGILRGIHLNNILSPKAFIALIVLIIVVLVVFGIGLTASLMNASIALVGLLLIVLGVFVPNENWKLKIVAIVMGIIVFLIGFYA